MDKHLNKSRYSLGIDVGGANTKVAVVDGAGTVIFRAEHKTPVSGTLAFQNKLAEIVAEGLGKAADHGMGVSVIGIGVPGLVTDNQIVGGINNLPFLHRVCLSEQLVEKFNLPVYVENDSFLMALAESRFGAASGNSDVVFLTVGTGIGGALMLNSEFYRGGHGFGSEIGHMLVQVDEGGSDYRTFESLASSSALVTKYRQISSDKSATGESLVKAYLSGNDQAVAAMEWHFHHLSAGIASLINIFNPERVVLGGGIVDAGDFYIEQLRSRVFDMAMPETAENVSLLRACLGNFAGCIGAARYASLELQTDRMTYSQ